MSTIIDIVIPFRNRDLLRPSTLLKTFRRCHKIELNFILSNYGSTMPNHSEIERFSAEHGILAVHSRTEGKPWSRAHAINNGVRASTSDWLCIVDVDMVVMDPVLDHLVETAKRGKVYFLESIWPQSPKQSWKKGRRNRSYGVFQFIHRSWFDKLSGFDERMEFWGDEDTDWVGRLKNAGAEIVWLPSDDFRLVHTWHPWENNPIRRPKTAVWKSLQFQVQNLLMEYRNLQWGQLVRVEERPLLAIIENELVPDFILEIPTNCSMELVSQLSNKLQPGRVIEVKWGARRIERKLLKWEGWRNWVFRLAEATSLEIQPLVNHNLEGFLISRELFRSRIKDYYLKDDLSGVWVLGGPT